MHLLVVGTSKGTAKKSENAKKATHEKKKVTKGFPLWRIWVHIIVTCTEDGNIQGMRGVRKHSYIQQEEQNMRQPSRVALNRNTAVQQY